jgi:mediator of RNA polymerase II transcription subunit 6
MHLNSIGWTQKLILSHQISLVFSGVDTLSLSWHDPGWIHILNPSNVMDYFSDKNNPFYDRTCSNEVIKMQRGNQDQLQLVSCKFYVIISPMFNFWCFMKEHDWCWIHLASCPRTHSVCHSQTATIFSHPRWVVRTSSLQTQIDFVVLVTPISDYYIIAGIVYQAPDLGSVISSRLVSFVHLIP